MPLLTPPAIPPAGTLGLCAPAGPFDPGRLIPALESLSRHFKLKLGPVVQDLLDRGPVAGQYLAASDEARAAELNGLLADPEVRGVLVARGGYGIMRILPQLDAAALLRDPKPIVGFSDATALLAWALHHGVQAIHGPVAVQLPRLPMEQLQWLVSLLTCTDALGAVPWTLSATGEPGRQAVSGPLIGGSLTLMSKLVGTPWALPLNRAVVLLEDVGEKPYAIDRYLTHLRLTGQFQPSAALVGDFTSCTDPPRGADQPDDPSAALAVIDERLRTFAVPGLKGAPVGHGAQNLAVPLGAEVFVDFAAHRVVFERAAVS
jgi:muramoyltetrapeptide carboxypeptidase